MQSRVGSIIESSVNILIGYGIATAAQMWIFHQLNKPITWNESAVVGAFMTVVSFVRSYGLRRLFNYYTVVKNAPRL